MSDERIPVRNSRGVLDHVDFELGIKTEPETTPPGNLFVIPTTSKIGVSFFFH